MDPLAILADHSWQLLPPTTTAKSRVLYRRGDGSELLLERRADNLRLWVIEPHDRRCFEIDSSSRLDGVLTRIVALQDRLTIETYITHYLDLSAIADVSIVSADRYE